MKVCVKSYRETQESCRAWAQEIEKTFVPDLIVFLARSGFLYAETLAQCFGCPMADVLVSRSAVKTASAGYKLLQHLPKRLWLHMLASPLTFALNERASERYLRLTPRYLAAVRQGHSRILVVDDSVDTGRSLRRVLDRLALDFPQADIRTAAYTVFRYSESRVRVDYNVLYDEVIFNATSVRSEENPAFVARYRRWCEGKRR